MKEPPLSLPEQSREAIHAAKNAAQAVEFARQEQLESAMKFNDDRTVQLFKEALREVFGDMPTYETDQLHVLLPRIPLLCLTVQGMSKQLDDIQGNLTWVVRIVIGAVIMAVLGLVFVKYL